MGNAVIGHSRSTELFTFTNWQGSWSALYPVSNLQVEPISQVARAAAVSKNASRFAAVKASPVGVRAFAFVGHNASVNGLFRIRVYTTSSLSTLLFDSGWQEFWPPVYRMGSLPYGHESFWTGKYTQEKIERLEENPTRVYLMPENFLTGGITVEVDDETNPQGTFACGMFEIQDAMQVEYNFAPGANVGFRFRTKSQEGLGGVKNFEREHKPRQFKGTIEASSYHYEVMPRFWEIWKEIDLDVPVIWMQDPDDAYNITRTSWVTKMLDPGLFGLVQVEEGQVPLSHEEAL